MTKKEQIEEMVSIMAASNNPFVDVPIEIMPKAAEALYNADYRKAGQVRKETAQEILQYIGNLCDDCDERFKLKDYQWHKNLCKKYGVEKEVEN